MHLRLEGKAVKRQSGLAGILYTEFSGDAGLSIFRRLDAACTSAVKPVAHPEASVSVSARGRGFRGRGYSFGGNTSGYNSGGGNRLRDRDLSNVTCHGCYQRGHYKDKCPAKEPAARQH